MNQAELKETILKKYQGDSYFFEVPDVISVATRQLTLKMANRELDILCSFWKPRGVLLDFSIKEFPSKFWHPEKLEFENRQCVSIIINNKEIKQLQI